MCTSGCGCIVATSPRRCSSSSLSLTKIWFQNTCPSLFTEMLMFSGFVLVASLLTSGRSTGTVCVITGIVIMKTISSTNMTSTRGVVLMSDSDRSSSSRGMFNSTNELLLILLLQVYFRGRQSFLLASCCACAGGCRTRCCCGRAGVDARAADQVRVQIGREVLQLLADVFEIGRASGRVRAQC